MVVLRLTVGVQTANAATLSDNMVPTGHYSTHCSNDTASADGPICQTDNATWSIHRQGSVPSGDQAMIGVEISADYDPTDLEPSYTTASGVVYSGSGETDLIYQESVYQSGSSHWSSGLIGETWCDDAVGGTSYKCDQSYVRFNSDYNLDYELICHETGHSVGLLHGSNSDGASLHDDSGAALGCMETPDTTNHDSLVYVETSEINSTY